MEEYTTEEQKPLFHQAQAGDQGSLAALMRQHEPLVHAVVQKQWSGGWRYADVVHEGRLGLWRAILNYDPDRGTAFSTYAWPAIARQVWRAVQDRQAEEERERGGGERRVEDVAHQVARHAVQQAVREAVARLPEKERWLVVRYYGLDGRGGTTQRHLGEQLGCTRQAIGYHVHKALRRLRHPGWSAKLRAQLGRNQRAAYRAAMQGDPQ